jgi:hypothetical protein
MLSISGRTTNMGLWALIRAWWHRRQRRLDMELLWPICLEGASDLDHAKAAFAMHCFRDPAWTSLGEDALFAFIDRLEAYD